MSHFLESWGRLKSNPFGNVDILSHSASNNSVHDPTKHTTSPIVTGTSVLGIVYKDGVMLAADCLASYGSMARFRDQQRLTPVGINTIIGSSGDISDLQHMQFLLQELQIEEYVRNDGNELAPWNYYEKVANVMYSRRTEMNPLWNSHVIGGVKSGRKFLGYVDLLGTRYQSSSIATGFGAYIAQPILRKAVEGNEHTLTFEQAKKLLESCMCVLYYRDARSLDKIILANITDAGAQISTPYIIESDWSIAAYVQGYY